MKLAELKAVLDTAGLPVSYRAFPKDDAPALPFLCYLEAYSNNFSADGVVYAPAIHVKVELYTQVKDLAVEGRVETALHQAGIYWEKRETYLEDEQCLQILYEIEV